MIEKLYRAYQSSSGICTDTRKIKENNVFFALKGPNFNANDFVLEALKQGCSYAVADEAREDFLNNQNVFIVDSALSTLQDLAQFHRRKLKIPIIALTGSNGKTTTKELMHAVLSSQYHCHATSGNFNNHIGVPLTILEIRPDIEIAIVEIGANHQGEIKELCEIAEPDYGLITNIGKAHLDGFGGEEGVLKGKKELFDFLRLSEGSLFINADDPKVVKATEGHTGTTYGSADDVDYQGAQQLINGFLHVTWWRGDEPDKRYEVQLKLTGSYNFSNVMASVAVGRYFGVSADKINKALAAYVPSNQRSQVVRTDRSNTVIVDCYNANPSSMRAAIENLAAHEGMESMAILGDMLELGETAAEEHQAIIDLLRDKQIGHSILVGKQFKSLVNDQSILSFDSAEELKEYLLSSPISNRRILLKGSRGIKLERLLDAL